jgi:alpha-mannosidase
MGILVYSGVSHTAHSASGGLWGALRVQDRALRVNESRAEFIWRASPSLGADAQVFVGLTGEYGGNYGAPSGFNYHTTSNDPFIEDDPALTTYNVKSRLTAFYNRAVWQANHTRGKHIMWTMGSDFNYENGNSWCDAIPCDLPIVQFWLS